MFRTQETLDQGKRRIDDVVHSLNDIGVRPDMLLHVIPAPCSAMSMQLRGLAGFR